MVVGSLAGIAVLYELVLLTHQNQLSSRLHSPGNVWLVAACLFIFGWGLALVAPRVARSFGVFAAVGGWTAGSLAAYGNQKTFAMPLLGVGLAAAVVVLASFLNEHRLRRTRMT
jgi:hypothetical protein